MGKCQFSQDFGHSVRTGAVVVGVAFYMYGYMHIFSFLMILMHRPLNEFRPFFATVQKIANYMPLDGAPNFDFCVTFYVRFI